MQEYEINTDKRVQAFLPTIGHESANFSCVVENLNYSASGLLNYFPKYFNSAQAEEYARKPERIANRVYANRIGNGNEQSGDGWKFRGRGLIQVTGRSNYLACGKGIGVDLINNPDLLCTPEYAVKSACWWFKNNGCNKLAG